jgi:hypothetical protein
LDLGVVASARVKKHRAAPPSRRVDTYTSMTCPQSIAVEFADDDTVTPAQFRAITTRLRTRLDALAPSAFLPEDWDRDWDGSLGPVRDSQEHWRDIRRELNAHRAVLGDLAAELYPAQQRIPGTTVLTSASWLPDGPVDLADVELAWRAESPVPQLGGRASQSAGARPLMASSERYDRYSRALRDLARPKLLDNRVSYRLLDVEWSGSRGMLGFNYTSYVDVLDVCEAVGHEFTQAWLAAGRKRPSFVDLPFRRSIIDPFDLFARPMLPSINTLTIRRDCIEGHRMYLHRRDAKAVAAAGGMYHVIPQVYFSPQRSPRRIKTTTSHSGVTSSASIPRSSSATASTTETVSTPSPTISTSRSYPLRKHARTATSVFSPAPWCLNHSPCG